MRKRNVYIIMLWDGIFSFPGGDHNTYGPYQTEHVVGLRSLLARDCHDVPSWETDVALVHTIKNNKIVDTSTLPIDEMETVIDEVIKIKYAKNKELPLLLSRIKTEEAKWFIQNRLKGEAC